MEWKRLSPQQVKDRVFAALQNNVDYFNESTLGVPGSFLDQKVFPSEASFLKEAPFLSAMLLNPNHIGCHTLGDSESYFQGTHELEREVVRICGEVIFQAEENSLDGYIASGGTEANIQALWIYRNFFIHTQAARPEEIIVICSEDSHYSMVKGANLINLDVQQIPVNLDDRAIQKEVLEEMLQTLKAQGKKYAIVVANMMTTMFGSVDPPQVYIEALEAADLSYHLHIDGAYGGFIYPFAKTEDLGIHFKNPKVSSIALDAHKMLQAPYGTGLFLVRKGLIHHVNTPEANYVKGLDSTLVGSRSGANAISVWMILHSYGKHGWSEKIQILLLRTHWLCEQLEELKIPFFHAVGSNIVSIRAHALDPAVAKKYGLVPDDHHSPSWFKVVIMEHVTIDKLEPFIDAVKQFLNP